ncbi:hypothetical protein ACFQRK_15990 [Parapedobacter sp. GCM10030251]|uniref:hypothetical protein n=1 Tax=Parapedobacter sp. GCM10030251 TaxID=3273419 RepID=UPI003608DEC7
MKRQTIYSMLIAVYAVILVTHVHAQTGESKVSEQRIRRLLSKDGTENPNIQFGPVARTKVQTLSISPQRELSVNSPQELRALIFENYTAPRTNGPALRSAATLQRSNNGGVDKLPSESEAEETRPDKPSQPPVQTPPTQGSAKEEER